MAVVFWAKSSDPPSCLGCLCLYPPAPLLLLVFGALVGLFAWLLPGVVHAGGGGRGVGVWLQHVHFHIAHHTQLQRRVSLSLRSCATADFLSAS